MFRLLILAIALGIPWEVTRSAPMPKEKDKEVLYFPTKVGTKWIYQSGDFESIEVITAVEEKESAKLVTVGFESQGKVIPNRTLSVSDRGLNIIGGIIGKLNEPLWILKLPHKKGNQWEAVMSGEPWGKVTGTAKAKGPETVKVPAGTFEAIRVTTDMPPIDGYEGIIRRTIWYAPGVGKIKEDFGDKVEVLKSFTLGKE